MRIGELAFGLKLTRRITAVSSVARTIRWMCDSSKTTKTTYIRSSLPRGPLALLSQLMMYSGITYSLSLCYACLLQQLISSVVGNSSPIANNAKNKIRGCLEALDSCTTRALQLQ